MSAKGFQHGDPRAVAAGVRGGHVSGARRFAATLARVQALWPGMPPAAARVIYDYGERRLRTGMTRRRRHERKGPR